MSFGTKTDGQLLAEFLTTGRQAPFEEIVRRHHGLVYAACLRLLGQSHDAEDAAQAVFMALVARAKPLVGRASIAGWLHVVACHVSQHSRRSAARRRQREEEAGSVKERGQGHEGAWERMKPLLDREVAALPEKYRLPLILHHLEGRTHDECSRQLEWSRGTFSTRLVRAQELLRSRLARQGVALSGGTLVALISANAASAAVSAAQVASTATAAALAAGGKTMTAGLVSAPVEALVQGGLKAMMIAKLKLVSAVMAAAAVVAAGGTVVAYKALEDDAPKQEQASKAVPRKLSGASEGTKNRLTAANMEEFHKLIRVQPDEYKWDEIRWVTSVWHARKKASDEDKPILVFETGGAGFNDPLGNC